MKTFLKTNTVCSIQYSVGWETSLQELKWRKKSCSWKVQDSPPDGGPNQARWVSQLHANAQSKPAFDIFSKDQIIE